MEMGGRRGGGGCEVAGQAVPSQMDLNWSN